MILSEFGDLCCWLSFLPFLLLSLVLHAKYFDPNMLVCLTDRNPTFASFCPTISAPNSSVSIPTDGKRFDWCPYGWGLQ
jgi:hypothetical protein